MTANDATMSTAATTTGVHPPRAHARSRRRWLGAGIALAAIGWGTNQFTPMLVYYRTHLGFSATDVTAAFGLYALGLVPGLLVAGPLSDRVGRRPVVLVSLALSMLAGVVLTMGPHGIGWLLAGRLLVGVASGSAFSTATTWLKELSSAPYENAPGGAGARRASIATTSGFGLGALVAGALAQWAPAPAVLPYLPQIALAGATLALTARTPETAGARHGDARRGPTGRSYAGGRTDRRYLRVVLPMAPWVFGSVAIGVAYAPSLISAGQTLPGIALAAAVAAAMSLAGVLVTPLARVLSGTDRPRRPRLLVAGLASVALGVLLDSGVGELGSSATGQVLLLLLAAVVLGAGYGFTQIFGLTEVHRLARPENLATMTAIFQTVSYTGFAAPFLLAQLADLASPATLLTTTAALAVATLLYTTRQARTTG